MRFFQKALFCLVLALAAASVPAQSNESDIIAALFEPGRTEFASLLDEALLKQVPEATIREVVKSYLSALGAFKSATGAAGSYTMLFEKGKASCTIALAPSGRIAGLRFGAMSLFNDSAETMRAAFAALEGDVSVCVTRNGAPVFELSADAPLAVGSAFKLYILKALSQKVSQGRAKWEDAVPLKAEWMSMGGGILETWPVGSPVTLHTLASLMISQSDNTATDQLLFLLGRETVEAVSPARVRPMLSTAEMIKLKWTDGGARGRAYAAASVEKKREMLSGLGTVPLKDVAIGGGPSLIKEVEWFLSTRELCQVIQEVKDLPLLSINPGLVEKAGWNLVGFKGGSEPGVLNFTHVLRKTASSPVYAVSATLNNGKKEIDLPAFAELTARLIALIENGKL